MEEQPIISQDDMAKLLGRSLSNAETNAYSMYLDIAVARLLDLLCLQALPETLPVDLALLLARAFAVISTENSVEGLNVTTKKVEDFSITYDNESEETPMTKFVRDNSTAIAKYSECEIGIRSGRRIYGDCFHCV